MSDYQYRKVLRVPVDRIDCALLKSKLSYGEDFTDLEFKYPEVFAYAEPHMFCVAPTEEAYIDYVLEVDRGTEFGDFSRSRALYDSEKKKYRSDFQMIDPNINMDNVRLVEFSWYDGVEAPDCYSKTRDPFYDEV